MTSFLDHWNKIEYRLIAEFDVIKSTFVNKNELDKLVQ